MNGQYEYIIFSVTTRCNLRCPGCFRVGTGIADVAPALFEQALPLLRGLGCRYLNISGGEPLMHPHWRSLIELTENHGIVPLMSTNGVLVNSLADPSLSRLHILAIPLDGKTSERNDRIRGQGHFTKATELLAMYREGAYPFRLKVNTIVTQESAHELAEMAPLVADRRIIWKLFQFAPRGEFSDQLMVTPISRELFLETVDSIRSVVGERCTVVGLTVDEAAQYLLVDPNGQVYIPEPNRYRPIGDLMAGDPIATRAQTAGLSGNSFARCVLGE